MTIKVYESVMPGEPLEVYQDSGLTVEQFVQSMTPNYQRAKLQPISCAVNGVVVTPLDWHNTTIRARDNVEFRPVPYGAEIIAFAAANWLWIAAGVALVGGSLYLASRLMDTPGQQGMGTQGSRISPADAKANQPRLGEGVPELFGRYIRYPDYVNAPRRYYQDKNTQVLRLMLSVGIGSYEIDPETIKIGETAISELSEASVEIFGPGASVAGNPAHENWYNAPEVGANQGSSGIRLRGITFDERSYSGSASGSGATISGFTPGAAWAAGNVGSIEMTQSVVVTDGGMPEPGTYLPDVFTGSFQHLAQGLAVNITSTLGVNGTYRVLSINPEGTEITLETTEGEALVDVTPDTGSMSIDKDGTQYEITATGETSIDVNRILLSGAPDPDWTSQVPQTTFTASIVLDPSTMASGRVGPFVACPEGETTQTVEVDMVAPQGLGTVDGDSVKGRTRTIKLNWREYGATTWNTQSETVSGSARDQMGWTFTLNLPAAIRPEVEIERVGGESTSLNALDRLEVSALRSQLPTVTSYPGVTTMAVTVVSSEEISSQSNNRINLVATRKLPPVAGGPETPTRSIARAATYVARTLGYGNDEIDVDELERLDALWASRGDAFDFVFNSGTAKEVVDKILQAGFAAMTLNNGVITPVRDGPRQMLEQAYSPANMTDPLQRTFTSKHPDEADGVEVEYTSADTWTTETIKCFLPGDEGIKLDKVKLDGVTDRTKAWRIGMRRRRAQAYRRWSYSFSTELDALNSSYLSYVPLIDDIPGYGKASIMQAIEAHTDGVLVTVNEPMEWVTGENHVIAYRDAYGDLVGPFPATRGDTDYQIIADIPEPWPDLTERQEPPHVYFGTSQRWTFPALVQDISPSGSNSCSVQAVNYDARVYQDDDNAP